MEEIKTQCQFCGAVEKEDGQYDGIKRPLFRSGNWSHGTCPKCYNIKMKEWGLDK